MNTETRTIMQWVAGAIIVLASVGATSIFVYDNIIGRPVDGAVLSLLLGMVSFAFTVLGFNTGVTATTNATEKANANSASVIQAANGNAHEVYSVLHPERSFATVPGALNAAQIPTAAPTGNDTPAEVGP